MIEKGTSVLLKEKPRNLKYAPGIATYGVKGKTGDSGENGTAVFFCDYDITDVQNDNEDCGLYKAINAISTGRVLLQRYSDTYIGRAYRNGDIIVSYTGVIYELRNINLISLFDLQSAMTNAYEEFFLQRGSVLDTPDSFLKDDKGATTELFIVGADGRVYFNSVVTDSNTDNGDGQVYKSLFQGLDIASVGAEQTGQDSNYILRVYNSSGNLVSMSTRTSVNEESYLNIYFDKDDSAFHMQSNAPICFDTPAMKIKNPVGATVSINDYSQVLTTENADSISSFYRMCSLARWTGETADDSFKITFDCSGYEFITNYYNGTLKNQLYCCYQETLNGVQTRCLVSMEDEDYVKYRDIEDKTKIEAVINKTPGAEITTVSLIRNIECYILKG